MNRSDTAQRERTIRSMLPMVRRAAVRLKRMVPSLELDDLIGDGSIGLIRAVDSFDPRRGPTLEHYARRLILGAMLNGIRRMDTVPERTRRAARAGEAHRFTAAAELGRMPGSAEIDRACPGYRAAVAATRRATPLSLDIPLPDGERLSGDWSGDPANVHERRTDEISLCTLVDSLEPRHRAIVVEHYFAGRSLRQISRHFDVSPQRISQLHRRAIALLQKRVHAATH